jgi:hypothetical protein
MTPIVILSQSDAMLRSKKLAKESSRTICASLLFGRGRIHSGGERKKNVTKAVKKVGNLAVAVAVAASDDFSLTYIHRWALFFISFLYP